MPLTITISSYRKNKKMNSVGAAGRAVQAFDECLARYQECVEFRDSYGSNGAGEAVEHFILDFELTGKRCLAFKPYQHQLFRLAFVECRNAQQCASILHMDRFTLYQKSLEVKELVGGALIGRGVYPVSNYFGLPATAQSEESGIGQAELLAA